MQSKHQTNPRKAASSTSNEQSARARVQSREPSHLMTQSCDQCQMRRKKCNRTLPCTLCDKSELKCTYANKLKKRGPKGKIVERIKRLQAQEDHGEEKEEESVLSISKRMDGVHEGALILGSSSTNLLAPMTSPLAIPLPLLRNGSLSILTTSDMHSLVTTYFQHIHPCYPFLDRGWLLGRLRAGECVQGEDTTFGTMVLALCALTMCFVSEVIRSDRSHEFRARREQVASEVILRHYRRALGNDTHIEEVITTFHLGLYFSILHGDKAGHFRVAEAAHLARSMGLHRAITYVDMDAEERIRAMAVYCFVVVRNRACELRQGTSEVVYLGQSPLLPAFDDVCGPFSNLARVDSRTEEICHLLLLINLYEVVTPNFCCCARDLCDPSECRLSASDLVRYAAKLERALSPRTCLAIRPALGILEQARWVEVMLAHQWIAAHVYHMAVRHDINFAEQEGGKYRSWPLEIVDCVAQVVSTAMLRSLHIQGTGMAHRLSYINDCASAYVQANAVDERDLERALQNMRTISDVVLRWDPVCWTRCFI